MDHTPVVKPKRVQGEEAVEALAGIPLLVIDEPEFCIWALDHAMVARAENVAAAVSDRVAWVFEERAEG